MVDLALGIGSSSLGPEERWWGGRWDSAGRWLCARTESLHGWGAPDHTAVVSGEPSEEKCKSKNSTETELSHAKQEEKYNTVYLSTFLEVLHG